PGRDSGWIDLGRLRVEVVPELEWRQMLREAWRLQRDQFWTPDMSQVDWTAALGRYLPLVERVATRAEFSDLIWEMQGELGTSHCYEFGGDHRAAPNMAMGRLGADFMFDREAGCYRITHLVRGDAWDSEQTSPLLAPGLGIVEGDRLLAVRGHTLAPGT